MEGDAEGYVGARAARRACVVAAARCAVVCVCLRARACGAAGLERFFSTVIEARDPL